MTITEAVAEMIMDDNVWARPVSMRGTGSAFVLKNNQLVLVPSATGGISVNLFADDIMSTWEVVSPNVVLEELQP